MDSTTSTNREITYADAGVNIDRANRTKQRIKYLAHKTFTKGVLSEIGGFGGLFSVDKKNLDPVLVSSVDGVGTKLKVAFEMNLHHTVGADLVNHCVNDIAVQGAAPLFFMDYLATGKLEPEVAEKVVGRHRRSLQAQRLRADWRRDCGNAGLLSRRRIRPRRFHRRRRRARKDHHRQRRCRSATCVLGLPSNGLHTNGYSLARKLLFEIARYSPETMSTKSRTRSATS